MTYLNRAKLPLVWVIGRGGLLGQSLEREIGSGGRLWHPPEPISWSGPKAGIPELRRLASQFLTVVGDGPWSVAWCAGVGVTGTSVRALQLELDALRETLDALDTASREHRGTFFFASSAGGLYAGAGAPPYDEFSPVAPISAYGQAKLEAESLVTAWSQQSGTPTFIGRIANLYGPGQNLAKAQGLVSKICQSYLTGRPVLIYVSLDTLRDYLFAPDCAGLIVDGLARLRQEQSGMQMMVITKVLASQRAITIGAVLGEIRRIFKKLPHIVVAESAGTSLQARDLSLRSRIWPEIDHRVLTPFPAGIRFTIADSLLRLQRGEL